MFRMMHKSAQAGTQAKTCASWGVHELSLEVK